MEISRPREMSQAEGVAAAGKALPFGATLYFLSLSESAFLSLNFFLLLTANMLDLDKSVHPLEHVLKL